MDEHSKLAYIRDSSNSPSRPFNLVQQKPSHAPEILASQLIADVTEYFRYNSSLKDEEEILMREILSDNDPRSQSERMNEAKRKGIREILRRGTFTAVLTEEIPSDANVIPGRFVLDIKSNIDGEIKYKVRFVVGGHRDKLKEFMVHSSQTLQPKYIRMLFAVAVIFLSLIHI